MLPRLVQGAATGRDRRPRRARDPGPLSALAGLVIRDLPPRASNWRSQEDLSSYLKKYGIVAIAGIDTRKLTRILREKGAQAGCIRSR